MFGKTTRSKTTQQNQAAAPNPQAVTDAQTAHDTAQKNLDAAKAKLDTLSKTAHEAFNDRIVAAKECAKALHQAQSDGIHNKHWWEHVGEVLSEWGGKIAEIANDLAPFLDVLALATSWIPGVDVVTAALAEADNLIALAGTAMEIVGDGMQGHWGDALMSAGMLGATFLGGKAISAIGGKAFGALAGKFGKEAEEGAESAVGAEARTAEGNAPAVCKTDPVDVVSGQMLGDEIDLELPGVLPVVLRRAYASGYGIGRLFGPGWSSTLDQRLSVNPVGIHFAGDDAQRLDYPVPVAGEEVLPRRGARWPLRWDREADEIRITDPWSGQTRYFSVVHFSDEAGQIRDLTAITDRNGNRIDILRDEQGMPTSIEHPAYRVAIDSVTTAAGPRITGIRLLDGSEQGIAVKEYRYDDHGRLVGVVDSSGLQFGYEYDDSDRITAWVDRTGFRYTYEYDHLGRVVRTGGDSGFLAGSFLYDEEARSTLFTNSLGHTTTIRYDEHGHVSAETDPLGNTVLTEYDVHGRLLWRVDGSGGRTLYERDEHGDVVRITEPDGAVTELAYNGFHQIVEARLADGGAWRRTFDSRGNLRGGTDPAGAVIRFGYADNGAIAEVTDPTGGLTTYQTDAAGLPLVCTDPVGAVTRTIRDAFGRLIQAVDPLGGITACGWSVEGQLLWRVAADGARTEWLYDNEGRLLRTTDPIGAVSTFEPGPFGVVTARTGADGVRHEFGYDSELNLKSVTNPAGSVWTYAHDAAGRLVGETDFTGRTLAYELDAVGRLVARTTGTGERIIIDRDAAGRITARRTPDTEYTYSYDSGGHLVAATGAGASLTYTRDELGRIVAETIDGRTTVYAFDAAGRRTSRTTPSGATSDWSFDPAGRPVLLDAAGGQLRFAFDAAGNEADRSLGADVWLSREHDAVGRLTAQHLWTGDRGPRSTETTDLPSGRSQGSVFSRSWAWRADDVPLQVQDSLRGLRRFTPDAAGRITAVTAANWSESYAYDTHGNLAEATLNETGSGHGDTDWSGSRLVERTLIRTAGRTHYTHDAARRLVRTVRRTLDGRQKIWEYTWDAEDRLVQASVPDGSMWRYRYDPLGRRISKTQITPDGSTGQHIVFIWDGPVLAEQQSYGGDAHAVAMTWDYEPDTFTPAAQRRRSWAADAEQPVIDEVFHAIITDLVGTPTELVDTAGRIAWHTTTSLWGRAITTTADPDIDCPLRFPGQYLDPETGLHYNLHRYYDPDTGSYLTPDPLGLDPAPNDHAYVPNPLTLTDPLGLMCARKAPGTPDPTPTDLPSNGASERGLWQLTEDGSTRIMKGGPFKTTFYKSASDGTWWTPDVFGHGESAFKVFRETSKGLEWMADADKYGDFMLGKHKGDTGRFIPWSNLKRVA